MPKLDWKTVDSSNVQRIAYDEGTCTLAVTFHNGGLYSYDHVDMEVFTDMQHAESVGKFLNAKVKPFHTYEKWKDQSSLEEHLANMPKRVA